MKVYKKLFVMLTLIYLLFVPERCFAIQIPSGTPVYVSAETLIDADVVKIGEIVNFSLVEPVRINGKVVIPIGTKVIGKVTNIKNNGLIGIPGKIRCDNFKIIATNGEIINLRGFAESVGNNRYWVNIGWVFWITLPIIFIKGEDGKIEPHHSFLLYTLEDVELTF